MNSSPGKAALYQLLREKPGETIGFDEFRMRFEELYTFTLDRTALTTRERTALGALFDKVTRYSPFVADRRRYPGVYLDEEQFRAAVEEAVRELAASFDLE